MAPRTEIPDAIEKALREADRLFENTNASARSGRDLTPTGTIIAMLGEHARRALRALRATAGLRTDDQVAAIARGIVDSTITVEYLHRPTVRCVGRKSIPLSVENKVKLFWSGKAITEQRSKEHDDKEAPKSEEYTLAVDLRVELGILKKGKAPSTYWSGTSPWRMYDELRAALAAEGRPDDSMDGYRRLFEDLSFYAHPNPNDATYFIIEHRPEGGAKLLLRDNHENTAVFGAAASMALLTLGRWAETLGEDPNPWIRPLVAQLTRPE